MASRTLLDYVQSILNETSGDEVNSITDTIEAASIARMVQQVYYEMVDEMALPSNHKLMALDGLGNLDKPNYMGIPQEVSEISWIEYDCRESPDAIKRYQTMAYMAPHEFVTYVNQRPSDDTDNYQIVMSDANVALIIGKTAAPQYWTSFDDKYIVFDSYDTGVEATLQSSKSIVYAEFRPNFILDDDFIPVLPDNLTNTLYIQCLNRCYAAFKETLNPKTERQESRMRIRTQRNKWRHRRQTESGPNYGR